MLAPKLDKRDLEKLQKDLMEKASKYVPELVPELESGQGAGFALLRIFAHMADQTLIRLNRVPDKAFLVFLDMLWTKLLPPQPARVPIQFHLNVGTIEDVLIPQRTQVTTLATEAHPAIAFETEKTMTATISQLKSVISADPSTDSVYDHTVELKNGESQLFVASQNPQHALYLGHECIFNFKKNGDDEINVYLDITPVNEVFNSDNIIWEYWGFDSSKERNDWILLKRDIEQSKKTLFTVLRLPFPAESKPIVIDPTVIDSDYVGILNELQKIGNKRPIFWVRARITSSDLNKVVLPMVNAIKTSVVMSVAPDSVFNNDIPLDLNNGFYPFGSNPFIHATFYISSQTAFSKKKSLICIKFESEHSATSTESNAVPLLSWEYWAGKGWSRLETVPDNSTGNKDYYFDHSGSISFICPKDIVETEVNGEKNYWVRVRIISGNYGIQSATSDGKLVLDSVKAIKILKMTITVNLSEINFENLEHCITKNYLNISNCDKTKPFRPFQRRDSENQVLYLGFDKPFSNGRISLFFSMAKQEYSENTKPQLVWSYFGYKNGEGMWIPLQVLDGTANLTENGTVEFVGSTDISKATKFGYDLYWIRAEATGRHKFQPFNKTVYECMIKYSDSSLKLGTRVKKLNPVLLEQGLSYSRAKQSLSSKFSLDKMNVLESLVLNSPISAPTFFHPRLSVPDEIRAIPAAPKLHGIHVNTTWAIQATTITDEFLGSSSGVANEQFLFSHSPILSETIWVHEQIIRDETILRKTNNPTLMTNEKDNWVKWTAVFDFLGSSEKSRHYVIDRTRGKIHFGDGKKGMIPRINGTIKATYQTGGGAIGNVKAGEVKNLVSSIAFVEHVVNVDSAQGGANEEEETSYLEKGPKKLQHRYRAVASEDYEWLSKEASPAVARAKCIPNVNGVGEEALGSVLVVIVPKSNEDNPVASPELIRRVKAYLKSHCPVSVLTLTVVSPSYFEISVTADVFVASSNLASAVKFDTVNKLQAFLHPISGSYYGKGWDFGKIPGKSDILAILHTLPGVDHVENLFLSLSEKASGKSFVLEKDLQLPEYFLICSGTHQINVQLNQED